MTNEAQRQSSAKFVFSLLGLTLVALVTTSIIAYIVSSPPRGTVFWAVIGSICAVEFLLGVLSVNQFSRAQCQYRPSGATLSITYSIVGAFAVCNFISIALYRLLGDARGGSDGIFRAILMGIAALWFIVAVLLYSFDLHSQASAYAVKATRAKHQGYARSLGPVLTEIRSVRTDDDTHRSRLAVISKKLETIDVALSHSHGGGQGSWEHPSGLSVAEDKNQAVQDILVAIQQILPRLSGGNSSDIESAISDLEGCVTKASGAVRALGL